MASDFTPAIYLNTHCPFCFKLRVFLLEAGLMDRVKVREFVPGTPAETEMREALEPHFDKLSFPAAQTGPGEFMLESDAIIDWFANEYGIDQDRLATFNAYVEGPFSRLRQLFQENRELKSRLE